MGSRTPKEIVAEFSLEKNACIDTFEAYRGDLFKGEGIWAVAIVNGGVDGPLIDGKPENWIDRFVVLLRDPNKISAEKALKESIDSLTIGGEVLGNDDWQEIELKSEDAKILLFEDSTLKTSPLDSPLSKEEAERFIKAFDFSEASWCQYFEATKS